MDKITASRNTWLKRVPSQASKLIACDKQYCFADFSLDVSKFEEVDGGHWRVEVPGRGTWYIYDAATHGDASHWDCSWEQDGLDEDDEKVKQSADTTLIPLSIKPPVGAHLRPEMDYSTRITEHITYGEICLWEEERRFNYAYQCKVAHQLCLFMEKARSHFGGKPIRITSGHRPTEVNRRVGGVWASEHLYRAPGYGAVDFQIIDIDIYDVQDYCDRNWPASVGYGAKKGFVHLGLRAGNKDGTGGMFKRWPY